MMSQWEPLNGEHYDLLPCPECGSTAWPGWMDLGGESLAAPDDYVEWLFCSACRTHAPEVSGLDVAKGGDIDDMLAAAWNSRPWSQP